MKRLILITALLFAACVQTTEVPPTDATEPTETETTAASTAQPTNTVQFTPQPTRDCPVPGLCVTREPTTAPTAAPSATATPKATAVGDPPFTTPTPTFTPTPTDAIWGDPPFVTPTPRAVCGELETAGYILLTRSSALRVYNTDYKDDANDTGVKITNREVIATHFCRKPTQAVTLWYLYQMDSGDWGYVVAVEGGVTWSTIEQ